MIMSRAVRQTRVATGGQASEHQARATWVNMLLCARWRVTHLFLSLRNFRPPPSDTNEIGKWSGSLAQSASLLSTTATAALHARHNPTIDEHDHRAMPELSSPLVRSLSLLACYTCRLFVCAPAVLSLFSGPQNNPSSDTPCRTLVLERIPAGSP